ncbi:MAG: helix-turn-helix transcriptional regulator, partial [Eisenbergiella sp.]
FIVKNALAYIEANYTEKLKLSDVADQIYVSQWHLSKLLNKHTGQNFSEILNNVRIEKAKELLKEPALRIGDIAEEVGFLDMAHFSRVFKKQVGISANEYRNTKLGS